MRYLAKIEEEVVELLADRNDLDDIFSELLSLIIEQERLDHENDVIRAEIFTVLHGIKRASDDAHTKQQVHIALSLLDEQQNLDLQDDKPRTELMQKLMELQKSNNSKTEQFRHLIGKLQAILTKERGVA